MHSILKLIAFAGVTLMLGGTAQAGTWNAMALDMQGGYGLAQNMDDEAAARAEAMSLCAKESCEEIFATESRCVAVSNTFEAGYNYGWSYGNTLEGVSMIAMGYCIEAEYPGCVELVSMCIAPQTAPGPGPGSKSDKNISN